MRHTLRPLAALLALAVTLVLVNPAAAQKPLEDPVLDRMQKDIFFLASPECEGRGIDTKGIEKAADYVADAFKAAGVKPAMKDGTYFQPFKVPMSKKLIGPNAFAITGPDDKKIEPKLGTDANVTGFSSTSKASGDLVFAGFGVSAPDLKYDDYDGLNVEGKIVVIFRRAPRYAEKGDKRFDTSVPAGQDSRHAFFETKIEVAAKHKVAGLIIVNDTTGAAKTDPIPKFEEHATGTAGSKFPVLFMKRDTFDQLLTAAKAKSVKELEEAINEKLKPQSFEIKGWKAETQVTVERKEVTAKNIVGVLEGAGPLKDETVVIGAHYDHVGYGMWGSTDPKGAGKIHYGADDNASGTTGLIELARRYGAIKNRQGRRLVFIAFSAEERGLDGSRFYCQEPVFPIDKTTTMLNMDMIGRTKPVQTDWLGLFPKKDRLVVYGTGTAEGFDKLVDDVTKRSEFKVTKIPGGTGPSDHTSFYLKKVPVFHFYTGMHPEYHKPTDVPEKIDVTGMKKVVGFVEQLADYALTVETKPKFVAVKGGGNDPTASTTPRPMGPRLGILPDYAYEGEGLRLEGVTPEGIAAKAGLKEGDVIVEVAGKPVKNITNYMTAMSGQKAGTTIDVVVERGGKKLTLKAELK